MKRWGDAGPGYPAGEFYQGQNNNSAKQQKDGSNIIPLQGPNDSTKSMDMAC